MNSSLGALAERTQKAFAAAYGVEPALTVAAPGRVNLIGEHTDYNDGFVMPAAIDRHIVMAVSPRADDIVRIRAIDMGGEASFSLGHIEHDTAQSWSNYERGVAWALQEDGYRLRGMDAVIAGEVPIGAGLSSSAAIEVATAYAFQTLGGFDLNGVMRAVLCQKAENEFVGMHCGIMDQYIVSLGQRDHALLIDCRSLEYELVPLPTGCSIVICDTKKQRGLVDSEYNTRRAECEAGAAALGIPALRDISWTDFQAREDELETTVRKRCRHVVSEDQRVMDAVAALQAGDLAAFGQLMNASHHSLRDDYAVSCRELDIMVEAAWQQKGVLGARMTGAGFGGCTVNLVRDDCVEAFGPAVARLYAESTGLQPEFYVCVAEQGVHTVDSCFPA